MPSSIGGMEEGLVSVSRAVIGGSDKHCTQVIYVSSRADEALLEALRKEPFPDAQHEPHEVSSQTSMVLQDCSITCM